MRLVESRAFVFDLDGVVWLGPQGIPGAADTIAFLKDQGRAIRFLTNNASLHREAYVKKLAGLGIDSNVGEIISSGFAAARYLFRTFGAAPIHVMGSDGLRQELLEAGLQLVERNARAVVVGYDREFNWTKLDRAFQNIAVDGASFIACNMDRRYVEVDTFRPGTGATVAALIYALEREPDQIIGKPHTPILDALSESLGELITEAVLVGDKLYTDIAAGASIGMRTILVRTGHGAEEEAKIGTITPTLVLDSIADIPRVWQEE